LLTHLLQRFEHRIQIAEHIVVCKSYDAEAACFEISRSVGVAVELIAHVRQAVKFNNQGCRVAVEVDNERIDRVRSPPLQRMELARP